MIREFRFVLRFDNEIDGLSSLSGSSLFQQIGHVSIVEIRTKQVENPSCGNSFLSSEIFFSRCLALF